jgi:hypothetical protein
MGGTKPQTMGGAVPATNESPATNDQNTITMQGHPTAIKHYRIAAKVRICYFEKPPKARKRYRITIKAGICHLC